MKRPPDSPPGRYSVMVLESAPKKIGVICPVCRKDFEIKKYGVVKCPHCNSKLRYTERK